jgi:hypothetical protein
MKKFVIFTIIILIVIFLLSLIFDWGRVDNAPIFSQNISATDTASGAAINGQNYSSTASDTSIIINNIINNQEVSNPITIEGSAEGNWFFEATFPVKLIDPDGNIISSTTARADTDWATTTFVNFTATLEYEKSTSTDRALIVLSNDNPSGDPAFSKSIFIPVILK